MNNLCFRTVILAIKSAEVQHCRRNTKKLNSAEKHQTLTLLNSFFLALLYPWTVLKHNTASEKQKKVEQCLKSSKVGIFEQHSFRRCCTNAQQCRSTTLPPKNKRNFNSANDHQILALMNNLCIGTVVLAINSAEVHHCRQKIKQHSTVPIIFKIGTNEQPLFRHCKTNHH